MNKKITDPFQLNYHFFSSVNIYKHYSNNKIYVNEDLKSACSSDQSDE